MGKYIFENVNIFDGENATLKCRYVPSRVQISTRRSNIMTNCVRRCKTTARPSRSDTLTAEIRHPFRWSDSWYFRMETGLFVGPHAV